MKIYSHYAKIIMCSTLTLFLIACSTETELPEPSSTNESSPVSVSEPQTKIDPASLTQIKEFSPNGPEMTAKGMLTALTRGDITLLKKYAYIPKDQNQKMIAAMLKESKASADQLGGVKEIQINSVEYNKDKTNAIVLCTIVFNDGTTSPEALALLKQKNKWVVGY